MAKQYINATDLTDAQYGVDTSENGISVTSFSSEFQNERVEMPAAVGGIRGFVTNHDLRRVTSVSGTFDGSSGAGSGTDLTAITGFNVAVVLNNEETFAGVGASGDDFLDSGASISVGQGEWKSLDCSFTQYDGLTVA